MEISAWAEQVLFGEQLRDKLADPGSLTDAAPGSPIARPAAPGRPPGLGFGRAPAPPRALEAERARGQLLHSFANHELLAAELMALVLLRFPEAPRPLRLGLAAALREEQLHLRLYLERLEALGLRFGELGLNSFFWDCLSGVDSPLQFMAGMGLGFEQANLDFGQHYAREFRRVGDEESARVLDRVVRDEVGHVRLGWTWLRRLKDPAQGDYAAWRDALPAPLTPERARGPAPSRALRVEAGLDESFLRQLDGAGGSLGRSPDVYFFDPSCEDVLAGEDPEPGRALAADLGLLPLVFCGRDDLLLVRSRPSDTFLSNLRRLGFEIPEVVEVKDLSNLNHRELIGRPLGALKPWGWHPGIDASGLALSGPRRWDEAWRSAYDKREAARIARSLELGIDKKVLCDETFIVEKVSDIDATVNHIRDVYATDAVLKAPFGTAGRGAFRWRGEEARRRAERILARCGGLVVEPWRERLADLSAQLDLGEPRVFHGLSAFFTSPGGRWQASFVGPWDAALEPSLRRFIHDGGRDPGWVERVMRAVAGALRGPPGPAGVDAFLCRGPAGPALRPLVELNPRFTMGRVALALRRRLAPRRVGLWTVVSAADARRWGHPSLDGWLRSRPEPSLDRGISGGVLSLSEPRPGLRFAGVLAVGADLAQARAALGARAEAASGRMPADP